MHVLRHVVAKLGAYAVKHVAICVHVGKCVPTHARIEVSEVHHGHKFGVYLALLDDLFQGAQLIDLAHGFNAQLDLGVSYRLGNSCQGVLGELHGVLAADLARAAAVNDNGLCSQQLCRPQGFGDIINALESFFLLRTRKRDEIRRVQRHFDAVLLCLLANRAKRALTCVNASACLVFIGIQSLGFQPTGCLHGGFIALGVKPFTVATGAKRCKTHFVSFLSQKAAQAACSGCFLAYFLITGRSKARLMRQKAVVLSLMGGTSSAVAPMCLPANTSVSS